jgi:lipid-A-disaccharide synthase
MKKNNSPKTRKIMVVAGEASGDTHAAKLVHALRETAPDTIFEFFGATSHNLRETEVETIVNSDNFSIVGLPEIGKALPMFWKAFQKLKRTAIERKPDAVILVDFPEFNLKLAKLLSKKGFKIVYYISPQLWAWRKYRVRTIRKYVDLLLTILPFEKNWYKKQGIHHIEYVGNPSVKEVHSNLTKEEFCAKHKLDISQPIVTLLPGSRHKEITRILPVLLETAALMSATNSGIQFVIALASSRNLDEVDEAKKLLQSAEKSLPDNLLTVHGETHEALNASDAAAVTSGTATLETGIIGTPSAIVYKTSPFNYKLMRPLISVEHFGLINLIAEERLVAELIQDDFMPQTLADELFRLLTPEINQQMRGRLAQVTEKLGHGGASVRAAKAILNVLD